MQGVSKNNQPVTMGNWWKVKEARDHHNLPYMARIPRSLSASAFKLSKLVELGNRQPQFPNCISEISGENITMKAQVNILLQKIYVKVLRVQLFIANNFLLTISDADVFLFFNPFFFSMLIWVIIESFRCQLSKKKNRPKTAENKRIKPNALQEPTNV